MGSLVLAPRKKCNEPPICHGPEPDPDPGANPSKSVSRSSVCLSLVPPYASFAEKNAVKDTDDDNPVTYPYIAGRVFHPEEAFHPTS